MADLNDLSLTLMPLDFFRKEVGIDPYHFWQMSHPDHSLLGCDECYVHYRWQNSDAPSRYTFLDVIMSAENMFADILRYWVAPKFNQAEEIRILKPRQPVMMNITPTKVFTEWRHVRRVGLQTFTPLGEDVVPVYTASDDVTITVLGIASGVAACEIVVTYPNTEVEIRPISVSLSSGTATITVKKWLMGDPDLWESSDCIAINAAVPFGANLLAAVDVHRKWIDPSQQITMAWEPDIYKCGCLDAACQVCLLATQTACALRGNYKEGAIGWQLADWNATDEEYNAATRPCDNSNLWPDLAYVNYLHGLAPVNCYMSPKWTREVTILAIAELDSEPCGCDHVVNFFRHWREDLGKSTEAASHVLGSTDIENPWVLTNKGHLRAWRTVKQNIGG